jgi:hypothetical protein
MEDLLAIYILLPIVYAMYKTGELADEKGGNPVAWRIAAFLITFTVGVACACLTGAILFLAEKTRSSLAITGWSAGVFFATSLSTGFILIDHLKKRKAPQKAKRSCRPFDMRNAMLFPRVIPRGGFLWRSIVYYILYYLAYGLIVLPLLISNMSLATLPWPILIPIVVIALYVILGITCFGTLYYICHICIPRIRDAGLSRDTPALLFIPGLNTVAGLMILFTPTSRSGRSTI